MLTVHYSGFQLNIAMVSIANSHINCPHIDGPGVNVFYYNLQQYYYRYYVMYIEVCVVTGITQWCLMNPVYCCAYLGADADSCGQ
jgi:hypothetical protein